MSPGPPPIAIEHVCGSSYNGPTPKLNLIDEPSLFVIALPKEDIPRLLIMAYIKCCMVSL